MDMRGNPWGPPHRPIAFHRKGHVTPNSGIYDATVGFPHGARPAAGPLGNPDSFAYRGGASNVLFMDGHVTAMADPGDGNTLDIAHVGNDMWIGQEWINPISP